MPSSIKAGSKSPRKLGCGIGARALVLAGICLGAAVTAQAAATHYVSSTATASSPCSSTAPCKPAAVWSRVSPGDTVIFKTGVYRGADYMLDPPSTLNGTAADRITVSAEIDGGVRIDGEWQHVPVNFWRNRYYVIEGFDAHSSSGDAVYSGVSSHDIILRRCVGWDAPDLNADIFAPGSDSLLEDCAAFGVARKAFNTVGMDNVTLRRVWARWEGSTHTGPKIAVDAFYFNSGTRIENAILTWDNGSMPASWHVNDGEQILSGPFGEWVSGNPRGTLSQGQVNVGEACVDFKAHGVISYVAGTCSDPFNEFPDGRSLVDFRLDLTNPDRSDPCCITLENMATWVDPSNSEWNDNRGFALGEACVERESPQLVLRDVSSVQATPNLIHEDWAVSDVETTPSAGALGDSIYVGDGAHICFRYENGATTNTPLWPWPMQDRIAQATSWVAAAGHQHRITKCVATNSPQCSQVSVTDPHAVADVMADIERMFGAPPSQCMGPDDDPGGGGGSAPPTPADVWRTDTGDE